jgi:hypothetical protein
MPRIDLEATVLAFEQVTMNPNDIEVIVDCGQPYKKVPSEPDVGAIIMDSRHRSKPEKGILRLRVNGKL